MPKNFENDLATFVAQSIVDDVVTSANKFLTDPEKEARLKDQLCIRCHYSPRVGGQAITTVACLSCEKDVVSSSTNCDWMCLECAQKHRACRHCSADIHLVPTKE